jgi:hypothetical protein
LADGVDALQIAAAVAIVVAGAGLAVAAAADFGIAVTFHFGADFAVAALAVVAAGACAGNGSVLAQRTSPALRATASLARAVDARVRRATAMVPRHAAFARGQAADVLAIAAGAAGGGVAAVAFCGARRVFIAEDAAAGLIVLAFERVAAVAVAVFGVADDAKIGAADPLLIAAVSRAGQVRGGTTLLVLAARLTVEDAPARPVDAGFRPTAVTGGAATLAELAAEASLALAAAPGATPPVPLASCTLLPAGRGFVSGGEAARAGTEGGEEDAESCPTSPSEL